MLLSENIYFLILFTLPAAIKIIYNAHIKFVPIRKDDKSVELAECVIFCLVVFLINICILRRDVLLFGQYLMYSEDEIVKFIEETGFNYLDFMIKYFIVNMISSIVVIILWYIFVQKKVLKFINFINKKKNRAFEYPFSDVWCNIFESKDILDIDNCIIKIEKAGNLVTAGLVKLYTAPQNTKKEFLLYNTDLIKQLFEEDKKKKLKKRMFQCAIYEYYDIDQDLLIKFYDTTKYDEKYAI